MYIKSIRTHDDLTGKKVLLRVDFNVPIENGIILDDYKIRASLITLLFLLRKNCKIIITSHLSGNKSLKPVALHLRNILEEFNEHQNLIKNFKFLEDCIGFNIEEATANMQSRGILFLENLRNHDGELKNELAFAKSLRRLADVYINNAFAVSHRNHASIDIIKKLLPSYAGVLLENEVGSLERILNPVKPFVLVMGGAKVETKLPLLKKLHKNADYILLGGAIANNFLQTLDIEIGQSKTSDIKLNLTRNKDGKKRIITPIDAITQNNKQEVICKQIKEINKDDKIFDIGPATIKMYAEIIKKASTIVWNGPMGKFEEPIFKHGTMAIGSAIAARSQGRAFGVVGGGETIEAAKQTCMADYIDWISTGGGAMLTYLSGKEMPGLKGIVNS